jgi:hypothetical protein
LAIRLRTVIFLLFIGIYVMLAAHMLARFAYVSGFGDSWRGATLEGMVQGTAERPYVYRILVPQIIGGIVRLTPALLQDAVNQKLAVWLEDEAVRGLLAKPRMQGLYERPDLLYMRLVAGLVLMLLAAGYAVALYRLGSCLFPQQWALALFTPVIGLLIPPALMQPTVYLYDMAVLALSAACYCALATHRWRWYYFFFILACVNKETSLFMLLFYTLWFFPRLDTRRFIAHWAAQLALFVAIRGAIYRHFADNPGEFLKSDYRDWHINTLLAGYDAMALIIGLAAVFLLTFRWNEKPAFARYGLLILAMMGSAFFLFGRPGEYRVFFDVVPLLAVLAAHTLIAATGISSARLFQVEKEFR